MYCTYFVYYCSRCVELLYILFTLYLINFIFFLFWRFFTPVKIKIFKIIKWHWTHILVFEPPSFELGIVGHPVHRIAGFLLILADFFSLTSLNCPRIQNDKKSKMYFFHSISFGVITLLVGRHEELWLVKIPLSLSKDLFRWIWPNFWKQGRLN